MIGLVGWAIFVDLNVGGRVKRHKATERKMRQTQGWLALAGGHFFDRAHFYGQRIVAASIQSFTFSTHSRIKAVYAENARGFAACAGRGGMLVQITSQRVVVSCA